MSIPARISRYTAVAAIGLLLLGFACFAAGLPFYRNDLISTLLISAVLFGAPAFLRRITGASSSSRPAAI